MNEKNFLEPLLADVAHNHPLNMASSSRTETALACGLRGLEPLVQLAWLLPSIGPSIHQG